MKMQSQTATEINPSPRAPEQTREAFEAVFGTELRHHWVRGHAFPSVILRGRRAEWGFELMLRYVV